MVNPKKSLGQHWLEDTQALNAICDFAEIAKGDQVLEIGPGKGSLSRKLLDRGAAVTAVELDQALLANLTKLVSEEFKLVHHDILNFDLFQMPSGYKVVANIPYYLTSKLIRKLSETDNPPKQITLLTQKEVAERICAPPGKMSLLSLSAQFFHDCKLGRVVDASLFDPPPKVDSQIVNLLRKQNLPIDSSQTKQLFRVAKAGFSSRRKMLANSLSSGLQIDKLSIEKTMSSVGIEPKIRPQELTVEQWQILANVLTS